MNVPVNICYWQPVAFIITKVEKFFILDSITVSLLWTISAITFIDVTKQYGVHSVGTLYRECMVKVVFHHERLYEIKRNCWWVL